MLTTNTLLRLIDDARIRLGLDSVAFAKEAGILESRWEALRSGRRKLNLSELPQISKAAKLSFEVVAPHHAPFMQLDAKEAAAVLNLAMHYKKNGPQQPHILRAAVEKLTRGK